MRLLYLLGGITFSLLGVAFAGPAVEILLTQARLMAGDMDRAAAIAKGRALDALVAREPRFADINSAFDAAVRGDSTIPQPRADRDNGLYAYLQLLAALPDAKPRPTTRPAEDAGLAERICALKTAPPVRLHAAHYRALTWAAFQSVGVNPRQAAQDADTWSMQRYSAVYQPALRRYSPPVYRPVLRRLAGGLLVQAKAWRDAGRAGDAVAADEAVARLMLDLVDDSPRPDVVLLASQYLAAALDGLAADAKAANLPPDIAQHCAAEKARVLAVRDKWHQAGAGGAGILPRASTIALARPAHDRVLGSVLASAYVIGVWLVLGAMTLILSLASAGFWGSGRVLQWRWNGWGRLAAVGIVAGLALIVMLMLLYGGFPFARLYSMGSAWAFVGAMLLVPVLIGLAARFCVCLPEAEARIWPSRTAVILMAVVALLLVAIVVLLPAGQKLEHPPAGVQLLRRVGAMIGLEACVLVPVWLILGGLRRRRLGLPRGSRSAANFGVAVWSWAAMTVLGLVVLQVNAHRDLRHEAAFVAATQDPLSDCLGSGWRAEHFQGARELISRIHKPSEP